MTTEREQILALAGEPVAVVGPVFQLLYYGIASIAAISERTGLKVGDKLYTADQLLAARKPLEEEIERLKTISDNYHSLLVDANQQLVAAQDEMNDLRRAVRMLLNDDGSEGEALTQDEVEAFCREVLSRPPVPTPINAQITSANARISELEAQGEPVSPGYVLDWIERYARFESPQVTSPLYLRAPQAVPREAIGRILTEVMDTAVANGANSISMPDDYVEVAAWLCGIPAAPSPEGEKK